MSAAIIPKVCAYCGATFNLSGGRRYKYCSDECYKQAHRKQCRENFRRRYARLKEREHQRNKDYYAQHPEKSAARGERFHKANPNYRHEYYLANPDKFHGKKN